MTINSDVFKAGDRVKCLKDANFIGGLKHFQEHIYEVTQETIHYYNIYHKDYVKVNTHHEKAVSK